MALSENRRDWRDTLFIGEREKKLISSIQSELIDHIVTQSIRYYPVDELLTQSNLYGESKMKIISKIYELYGRVNLSDPVLSQDAFGLDRKQTIEVYLQRNRVYDDYNFTPKSGDYIEFDKKIFEITTINDDKNNFGHGEFKLQILITGTLARQSNIKLIDDFEYIELREN